MHLLLLFLALCVGVRPQELAGPEVTSVGQEPSTAAINAAIAAQATAAVQAGEAAEFLVVFRTREEAVASRAEAISTAAGLEIPTEQTLAAARRQEFRAVKALVLDTAPATAPSAVNTITTEAGPQQATASPAIQVTADFQNLPIAAVSISSAAELARLQADPNVLSVQPNGIVRAVSAAAWSHIGQPLAAARGFNGSGTVVVIDTGLDYTKPVFGPCTAPGVPAATCRVVYTADMVAEDGALDSAGKSSGHGTNVAGIVASVAPGAKLIGLDVFDLQGNAFYKPIAAAVDWVVANKDKYNVTVINLSLGGESTANACDGNVLSVAINTAYDFGVLSTAAAGNEAKKNAVLVPACATRAVAVGAVYSTTTPGASYGVCSDSNIVPDKVCCFSNSSPKVALLAPGHALEAAGITLSGTSQACPVVAGAIAVVRGAFPSYTMDQVVDQLKATGTPVTDPGNGLVIPRVDLRKALGITCTATVSPASIRAAHTGGTYTFTVTPPAADCTWTIAGGDSWMRIVGATSGKGPATVTLQVEAVGDAARSAGLWVTADGTTTLLVSQAVVAAAVDDRPPAMGRLKGTSASGALDLVWPAAQDSQSGVSSYTVVYSTGARPPRPRCTTGTPVAQQPQAQGSSYRLSLGLTSGQRYSVRVCAVDAAGNVAVGSMWRGTPL